MDINVNDFPFIMIGAAAMMFAWAIINLGFIAYRSRKRVWPKTPPEGLKFYPGQSVGGKRIVLDDGTEYTRCYLPNPPQGGTVWEGKLYPYEMTKPLIPICQ